MKAMNINPNDLFGGVFDVIAESLGSSPERTAILRANSKRRAQRPPIALALEAADGPPGKAGSPGSAIGCGAAKCAEWTLTSRELTTRSPRSTAGSGSSATARSRPGSPSRRTSSSWKRESATLNAVRAPASSDPVLAAAAPFPRRSSVLTLERLSPYNRCLFALRSPGTNRGDRVAAYPVADANRLRSAAAQERWPWRCAPSAPAWATLILLQTRRQG